MECQTVKWKIHLQSSVNKVYSFLVTDKGRSKFWAEKTSQKDGKIHFSFSNGLQWTAEIIADISPLEFSLTYLGNSKTIFLLSPTLDGGCDLFLIDQNVDEKYLHEVNAGWVSVLLTLKAAVDHNIDLRNHHSQRTWDQGYVDN